MDKSIVSRPDHNGKMVGHQFIAGFHLTENIYEQDADFPMHTHERACFCLVLKGRYVESYRSRRVECKPSQVNFRPAEEVHADQVGANEVRCFIIEPDDEWLGRFQKTAGLSGPHTFECGSLVWLATRIHSEFRRADEFTPLAVEGLMLEFVGELARSRTKPTEKDVPCWLITVRDMLRERFSENISLEKMAEHVGVHPVYLAAAFRKHFNSSIGDYVRRMRVEYAGSQLAETETPLVEIALDAGFAHQSHFTHAFKRLTGFTPAAYRANHRPS